jgi:hypothetical protein
LRRHNVLIAETLSKIDRGQLISVSSGNTRWLRISRN